MSKIARKLTMKQVFTASIALSLFVPGITMAGIKGIRSAGRSSGGGNGKVDSSGSSTVQSGKVTPVNEKVKIGDIKAGEECNLDPNASEHFPMEFFKQISRDGEGPTFEVRNNNTVMMNFPAIINTCGKFVPQPYTDPKTKNVTVMVINDTYKTYGAYLKCLENNNILVDGNIDHDKIESKNYSEYPYVFNYDYDKEKDVKSSIKLSFGYPKAFQGKDGYDPSIAKDTTIGSLPVCMEAEKIVEGGFYLHEGEDKKLAEIYDKCKSGDINKILDARKSIGNADSLKDIADKLKFALDGAYLEAVKPEVEKIYKAMEKIEEDLDKNPEMEESKFKKLAKKYADLALELDSKYLNYAIHRLKILMEKYEAADDEDAKKKLAEDIEKLNKDIGKFHAHITDKGGRLYDMMESFATNDSAKTIQDISQKSRFYAHVYPGEEKATNDPRGTAISFDDANKRHNQSMVAFDRDLNDWTDIALAKKGTKAPFIRTQREVSKLQSQIYSKWNRFQTNENNQLKRYCGVGMLGSVNNPTQCRYFQSTAAQRRERTLKGLNVYYKQIGKKNYKYSKMEGAYVKAQNEKMQNGFDDLVTSDLDTDFSSSLDFGSEYPSLLNPMANSAIGQERYLGYANQSPVFQNGVQQPQMYQNMPGQYQYQMQSQGQVPFFGQ